MRQSGSHEVQRRGTVFGTEHRRSVGSAVAAVLFAAMLSVTSSTAGAVVRVDARVANQLSVAGGGTVPVFADAGSSTACSTGRDQRACA